MACYLCAYLCKDVPNQAQPLPPKSPAQPNDPLASCWKCWVWACSTHGTLYSLFECARCTPSVAVTQVLITGPTNPNRPAAAALAYRAGLDATPGQINQMRAALGQVIHDANGADIGAPHMQYLAPTAQPDNLVADLAGVISKRTDLGSRPSFLTAQDTQEPAPDVSVEAIGASVRSTFKGVELAEPSDEVVVTVMGALLMADAVAHDPIAIARSAPRPTWPNDNQPLPPPWAVSHPGLLDPVMWLIGTAYEIAS